MLQASTAALCDLLGIPLESGGAVVLQKTRETMESLRAQNRAGAKVEFARLMWQVAKVGHAHTCISTYEDMNVCI